MRKSLARVLVVGVATLVLAQFIDGRIAFALGIVAVVAIPYIRAHRARRFARDIGLSAEDVSLIQQDLRKGDNVSAESRIADAQEVKRKKFKEATGIDVRDIIPVLGRDTSLKDIVKHAFRVLDFEKGDTTIDEYGQVHATSATQPYGFLLVESPILNQKARLAIIHKTDFFLASTAFDEPTTLDIFNEEELLVTYAPKVLLPKGLSGSLHHVLHYVICPRGTLELYYSAGGDMHMAKPNPEILFGPFVYEGEVRVRLNPAPVL